MSENKCPEKIQLRASCCCWPFTLKHRNNTDTEKIVHSLRRPTKNRYRIERVWFCGSDAHFYSCIDATHTSCVYGMIFWLYAMVEGSVCVLWATKHYWGRFNRTHLGYTHIRISDATKKEKRKAKNSRRCVRQAHINRVYSTKPTKNRPQPEKYGAARKWRTTEREYIRSRSVAICECSVCAHFSWG